jgi:deferrochelatase/peroxidase EfeB
VQGVVLRGYHMRFARYFTLSAKEGERDAARGFAGSLVDGSAGVPQIQTAVSWGANKPSTCLNIGFTSGGLVNIGMPSELVAASFNTYAHRPFYNGAATNNVSIGDVGPNDPQYWLIDDRKFDVMLALWADTLANLNATSAVLRNIFSAGFTETGAFDSQDLPDGQIYFGYRDGLGQPTLIGNISQQPPDGDQTLVDTGAFILGTGTTPFFNADTVNVPQPAPFGNFGSFGAFRMLQQHVDHFEAFLDANAPAFGQMYSIADLAYAREALKATIIGRWSNGTSLMYWPFSKGTPPPNLDDQTINDFGYANDLHGYTCPFGSHIRRGNPRDSQPDQDASLHRIMRRAMPYQNPYDPNDRNTGETGLIGFFINSSLTDQFEFLMSQWIDSYGSLSQDPADPAIGYNVLAYDPSKPGDVPPYNFTLSAPKPIPPPRTVTLPLTIGAPPFTQTRGSAYCFLPGICGIEWIATKGWIRQG